MSVEDSGDRRRVGAAERHFHTAALSVLVIVIGWIGWLTMDLQREARSTNKDLSETVKDLAVLAAEVRGMLENDKTVINGVMSRIHALEDRNVNITSRIRDCEERVLQHEVRCHRKDDKGVIKR